jgi:hypothetical protein
VGIREADIVKIDSPFVLQTEPVGSRVTCDPAPTDTDRDWLVLVDSNEGLFELATNLQKDGWSMPEPYIPLEGGTGDETVFMSCRKAEDNLILTDSPGFFKKFMAASSVAKRLNLLDKADRIALFQAVLYANADEAFA